MNLYVCSPDCLPITITSMELQLLPGAETSTVLDNAATAAWSAAMALVLATNIPLILLILRKTSNTNTFLDRIIITDCCIGVANCFFISIYKLNIIPIFNIPHGCLSIFIILFLNTINRFLNATIAVFRYVFITHNSLVQTSKQRKLFHSLVLAIAFIPSLIMTGLTIFYRNNYYSYLSIN